ncbi:beta-ketoacyl-ACP synthase III [Rhizomicrobium electricum]|uniref:beta-ketoacyl-ACP synthase III n=1 Tax=Rhizomicrobium electricum TaxID=480070 RepID=UPI001FB8EB78|nr:beta-ketoacyl-ACP synthase III [Rhizomicrobium electricum]
MRNLSVLAISGSGVYVPSQTINNEELVASFNTYVHRYNSEHEAEIAAGTCKALLESSSEFIVKASGIKNRYVLDKEGILDPDVMCPRIPERPDSELSVMAEMAVAAAREALATAEKKPSDIDAVICSCAVQQRAYPAMAIEVQGALGITGFAFDMSVGCASATYAVHIARGLIETGGARAVLVVNPEVLTGHANFRERDSHFLFGDACTAYIVERAETARGSNVWEIVSTKLKAQFSNNIRNNFGFLNRCAPEGIGKPDKLFVQQGRKVFKEVLPLVGHFIVDHLAENNLTASDVKRMWLHQANINMNLFLAHKVLGRDPTPDEAPNVIDQYANTSSAGAIIAFNKHSADLKSGDVGLLCTFGAGYSAGSVILKKM